MAVSIETTRDIPDLAMRSLEANWNYARWATLPADGNRYEVIDGVLYMTTAPSFFHQWIVKRLERHIGIPAEDQNLGIGIAAPIGVIMPGCDPVQPDYVFILQSHVHIVNEGRINGIPDLLIEVVSPSTVKYDEKSKLNAYARAEVPEYVIIDPRKRTLQHYRLEAPGRYATPTVYNEDDSVSFDCLPTISLTVGSLFAGAPDTTL